MATTMARTPSDLQERGDALAVIYREVFAADMRENSLAAGADGTLHAHTSAISIATEQLKALQAIPDDELLKRIFASKRGKKIKKLWNGDTSAHGGDHSVADAALCSHLAFWTAHDVERMDRLFRQSKLYRPDKWDRDDYRDRTIALACQSASTYQLPSGRTVSTDDFIAYLPQHTYIFVPTREMWPSSSVNASVPPIPAGTAEDPSATMPASAWLDRHRAAEQMTWAPGQPLLIRDRLVSDGGWIERPGCNTINLYRPPQIAHGDPSRAAPWLTLVRTLYDEHAEHIIAWFAHRVRRAFDKINHALVLGGPPGIGKDTLLEPVKQAVGPWNFSDISPTNLFEPFNPYVKSVILRISEARDMGDVNRYGFYEHMKVYEAAPPDVLRVNEKNIREYAVANVCGVIFTTNHKTDCLYLPADDRRHFVLWSERTATDFAPDYWDKLWQWYADGGFEHVAAYLANYDLTSFNPKAPPPKTPAFWDIVAANRAPENAELADALDALDNPAAITLQQLVCAAAGESLAFLNDRKYARQVPHRLSEAGYVQLRNDAAKDGLWKIQKKRQAVYVRQELGLRERQDAVRSLIATQEPAPRSGR
jgi:hypothetical protein